jgi:hypothetical protein
MRREKEIRILPSSPDYEEINLLATKIAVLKNPHLYNAGQDIPQAEVEAALSDYEEELQELLDFQLLPFNKVLVGISSNGASC